MALVVTNSSTTCGVLQNEKIKGADSIRWRYCLLFTHACILLTLDICLTIYYI